MLDISKLQLRKTNVIEYNDVVEIPNEKYENTDIRSLSKVNVNAIIKRVTDFSYNMTLSIKGVMTLPCAVTLKDVEYPFDISNEVKISNENTDEDEDYVKIFENSIDILEVIWQNILMEIPLRVVSEDVSSDISGDGWKLIRE